MLTSIEAYLALRRSMGFRLEDEASLLRRFASWSSERGETHVSAQSVIAWAVEALSPWRREKRLRVVAARLLEGAACTDDDVAEQQRRSGRAGDDRASEDDGVSDGIPGSTRPPSGEGRIGVGSHISDSSHVAVSVTTGQSIPSASYQ